jgi:hypothetical protein
MGRPRAWRRELIRRATPRRRTNQHASQAFLWSTPLVGITTWRDNQAVAYDVKNDTDFVILKSLKEKRGIEMIH